MAKPQGGYVAKQCPARAQWDTVRPCEPLPPSPFLQRLFTRGRDFESQVVTQLLELHPDALVVTERTPQNGAEREQETFQAMRDGVPLILGGRLPADPVGRRVGEPDLLVATVGGGYRAADVKHHLCLHIDGIPAHCSSLDGLTWEAADPSASARKRKDDLFQLAHYQRMLEAIGRAAPGARLGAIIGTEKLVTWFDLDAVELSHEPVIDVYDREFAWRLAIIDIANEHNADLDVELAVGPVRVAECGECPWKDWCRAILEQGSGDVSLVPYMTGKARGIHLRHGTRDRAALAALDYRTASLVAAKVDLTPIIDALDLEPPGTPLRAVIGNRRWRQLEKLNDAGLFLLGDARKLCLRTAGYPPMGGLPGQIDQARAVLGDVMVYRRRGVIDIEVPRGDVEVDVDVENDEDGVYLWGTLVSNRAGLDGIEEGYRPFCDWRLLDPQSEAELFAQFWEWFSRLWNKVTDAGSSFRAYCYNEAHENSRMRRCAAVAGLLDEVEEFIASGQWVDLLKVFMAHLITGNPVKLKATAPLSGFSWDVEEAAGDESMVQHDDAVLGDEAARDWLLTYNRNDVEATLALRDWLQDSAGSFPSIERLEVA